MSNRVDELLSKLLNGETSDITPQSRIEAYLKALIDGSGTDGLPTPQSSSEAYFYALVEQGLGGGGGGGSTEGGFTMQDFVDSKGSLRYLYYGGINNYGLVPLKSDDLEWLTKIDTSNFTYTTYMFANCPSDELDAIPLFDMSNVTNMGNMFSLFTDIVNYPRGCALRIPAFDTSKVTNMESAFKGRLLANFPQLRYDSATNCNYMFEKTMFSNDTTIPTLYLPKVTTVDSMFKGDTINYVSPTSFEGINAPNCTNFNSLFNTCINLETVGDIVSNASSVTLQRLFYQCYKLKSFGSLPISACTSASGMFNRCYDITVIPKMDFPNCTNMGSMFNECTKLKTVECINMRSVTSASSMFYNAKVLENLTLKNIKCSLQVGSGTSYGHLLTVDSLVGLCYELRDTGSSGTLTIGNANLAKLANVYVREITITDEMRTEDDLIDEKLPFEVCESTDEGATLITDYVLFKNWQLA